MEAGVWMGGMPASCRMTSWQCQGKLSSSRARPLRSTPESRISWMRSGMFMWSPLNTMLLASPSSAYVASKPMQGMEWRE